MDENTTAPKAPPKATPVVVVLTPYSGLGKRLRTDYLRRALAHAMMERDEVPVASHQLLAESDVLTARRPTDYDVGLAAQCALINVAERVVAYVDHGISAGMTDGIEFARSIGREVVFESIGK